MGRTENAIKIVEDGKVEVVDRDDEISIFSVEGSGDEYEVVCEYGFWVCDCPDYTYRHVECKHIRACKMLIGEWKYSDDEEAIV